jgi:hypothetical protein
MPERPGGGAEPPAARGDIDSVPGGPPPGQAVGYGARAVAVAGTGAVLLAAGIVSVRGVPVEAPVPPMIMVVLYTLVAAVAVAGMLVAGHAVRRPAPPDGVARGRVGLPAKQACEAGSDTLQGKSGDGPHGIARGTDRGVVLARFQVDVRGARRIIAAGSVHWVEACGNYVRLHLPGESHLYRMSLGELEAALDPHRFLRVHRSALVNLDAITRVEPLPSGDADLWLEGDARVRLSRRYAKAFHERTGRSR